MRQSLAMSSCGCGLRDTRRSIGSGYAAPIKKTTAANNGISCLIVMQGTCPHLGQPWPLGGVTRRLRRCSGRYYPCFARLSFLHEPAHLFNGPVLACFDHTNPRASSLIDKRVGEQNSSAIADTRRSVVGSQFKVKAISPGQIRHKEPSSSSTILLLSCFLMSITLPRCELSG
jgi:hypothetical protein